MSNPGTVNARATRLATQQGLLRSFVESYGQVVSEEFNDIVFPDVTERSTPECDCVAKHDGAASFLAIEHTEIEALRGKNENDKKFLEHFQGREGELSFSGFDLHVSISGEALTKEKKFDWGNASDTIFTFLRQKADSLPFECSEPMPQANLPFVLRVYKTNTTGQGKLIFYRFDSREFRNMSLNFAIQKALSENTTKLVKYSPTEYKRILLMENKDVQITFEGLLYEIYLRVTKGQAPQGYDEVWLCWSLPEQTGPVYKFICFEGDGKIAAAANELFDVGPHWKGYWWNLIQTNDKGLPTLSK